MDTASQLPDVAAAIAHYRWPEPHRTPLPGLRHNGRVTRVLPLLILLLAGLASTAVPAHAQEADSPYTPATGNADIDRHLADINEYAARYPAAFADEMTRYYAVPRAYVEAMQQQPDWTAGDIFMACALAQIVGQPCRAVVREWSRDHEGGWKAVAGRLQAAPGSPQYRRLRSALEATYRRWDRPAPES
ncbi:MAG TPA: hypothetical protein VGE19_06140 [Pseudoxanthomonas sp.]